MAAEGLAHRLHITNGDSATAGIRAAQPDGDLIVWRDVLHEGPVPDGLDLAALSDARATFLAGHGLGELDTIKRDFRDRDNCIRRFTDYDEVVLWFEWDLYDQLQLLQILDVFAPHSNDSLSETGTTISLICIEGYLGRLETTRFVDLLEGREKVSQEVLELAARSWAAFRSSDPRNIETLIAGGTDALPFLAGALERHLEEFPSTGNGLSRSERQILEAVAQGPLSFAELFRRASAREERIYCGDAIAAGYIERMSRHAFPLLAYPTGEAIDAPHTEQDSRAFRNSEIALTRAGREVLNGDQDWIAMGGSDRWLGGVHLTGRDVKWRWDAETRRLVDRGSST